MLSMPIYEYACTGCGQRFERLVGHGDGPRTVHCDCGSAAVERIPYSRVAIATRAEASASDCGEASGECCGGMCRAQ